MEKVDFICVGPGRSGTTWLYNILDNHPNVRLPNIKETEFFNNNYQRGIDWYLSLFNKTQGNYIFGEISNMYYSDINALKLIKKDFPKVKVIFMARKPSTLFNSYVNFGIRRGIPVLNNASLIQYQPLGHIMGSGFKDRLKRAVLSPGDVMPLLEAVDVAKHMLLAKKIFVNDMHVIQFDCIKNNPQKVIQDLCAFLEIENHYDDTKYNKVTNATKIPRLRQLGIFASNFAFFLRKIGAYAFLNKLHKSSILKKILLKSPKADDINLKFDSNISNSLRKMDLNFNKEIDNL